MSCKHFVARLDSREDSIDKRLAVGLRRQYDGYEWLMEKVGCECRIKKQLERLEEEVHRKFKYLMAE